MKRILVSLAAVLALSAKADSVDTLNGFLKDVKSGRASFSQTVTSPDGKKTKKSSGSFEFQRPNQFRFVYQKPFEQTIVADGQKVWIYDPDLNQASSRRIDQALGATPAALLAGGNVAKDFVLKALPADKGLDWVLATPRQAEGSIQSLKIGFKAGELAALEIVDAFGQKSLLEFAGVVPNPAIAAERFRFQLPAGADLIEQ
ncbi:outer membrane lipoprotein chaperone LolA [Pelomonas sp. SE-A7]|uniref:outer membrane lipoprotein chaperone LolA n=1 Tax=Pelomonas sp. SE-A7 TaxID=3054953 RepID=UPI00259C7F1A|nr:outer membrane lipoprotein chaperone LolA [Pelomonas sp. SE-A7]MDM4765454.1 outer membrane lipoprotein chaperone LolA [Pelomonas sp. SE-A7]